jgi:short-subunit dehydrogenase
MMQAPYFAAFNITHAFLTDMLERGTGLIISVNSPACIVPWPSSVGYTAARAALRGFHHALSQDLAGSGVACSHVIFGKISSEYFDNNPGVIEKMPWLSKTVPTLSVDASAEALTHLAAYPRHTAIYPWVLRIHCGFGVLFPRLARWLLRF